MGFAFNPFTGNFDVKGAGGGGASYIDGEVATYADLPLDGTAALNSAWLVRTASGVWPVSRKQAGIYIRTATGGSNRDADYTYAGTMPDVFSDSQFLLYDNTDSSKNLAFDLGGITTGTTSTLTVPASGTIARTQDFASPPSIGSTTRNSGAFTTLVTGDTITAANATTSPPTGISQARGLQFASLGGTFGNTAAIYGSYPSTATLGIGIQNNSAGIITQVAAFTSTGLSVNGGTVTASAPVLDLSQTWNNAAVAFTGLRLNVTNTASASQSALLDLQVGGSSQFVIQRNNVARFFGAHYTWFTTIGFETSAAINGATPVRFCAQSTSGEAGIRASGNIVEVMGATATNPQTFRLYNTFTDASNHERGFMRWSSNVLQIGTEKAGTGSARALEFQTDGVTRFTISDIGAMTLATGLSLGFAGRIGITPISQGAVRLLGTDGSSFNFLYLGINSASYPALKRVGTAVQIRLGNDSDFAPLACSTLTLSDNLTFGSGDNIVLSTTTGTQIGTATNQLLGFYGVTPVDQPATVADPTGGGTVDAEARTAINDIIDRLQELGLIA